MALLLLAWEHIAPAFAKLADTQLVTGNTAIQTLLEYVKTTRLWPGHPVVEGVPNSVRSNNDVEGWHNRLNSRCRRAIWTCTSWPRFCSRNLHTSAPRLHWCLRHVCAGTSGRPISACKGGWQQCGRLTRPDSGQRRHCSASARVCSGVARHFPAVCTYDVWRPNSED